MWSGRVRFELPSPDWNVGRNDRLCFVRVFFRIGLFALPNDCCYSGVKRPDVAMLSFELHDFAFVDLGAFNLCAAETFFPACFTSEPRVPYASCGIDVLFVRGGGAGVNPSHRLINGADVSGGWIAEGNDGAKTRRLLFEHFQSDGDDARHGGLVIMIKGGTHHFAAFKARETIGRA